MHHARSTAPHFLSEAPARIDITGPSADNVGPPHNHPELSMTTNSHIGACLSRACDAFKRRPSAALQEDSPAVAVWDGALGTKLSHAAMPSLRTDMPPAMGGDGAAPSPGWYFRAGVASCLVTSIAMQAAMRGIALKRVEVEARSESDARGMLGIAPEVPASPVRFWLTVTLEAHDTPQKALRDLVEAAHSHSPMSGALRSPIDVAIDLRLATAVGA